MKKDELLKWLEQMINRYTYFDEQAYQEIVALIKASFNLKNKSLGKLAKDLGVSFSATKIISDHAQPEVSPRLEYDDDGNVVEMGISGGTEQKPQVTEEWIEEKAREILNKFMPPMDYAEKERFTIIAKDFIRSLFKKIHGRK